MVDVWCGGCLCGGCRTIIKNHPGSLLALADEHMEEMKLEKTKENYRIQKPAIVSKAINRVIGYNPGKDCFLFFKFLVLVLVLVLVLDMFFLFLIFFIGNL